MISVRAKLLSTVLASLLPIATAGQSVVVRDDVAPNTEPEIANPSETIGFSIAVDGKPLVGNTDLSDRLRRTDVALAEADLQVRFDGLNAMPRLDVEALGQNSGRVTLQSRVNYPAFVARAEMRILRLDGRGGIETVSVVPVEPNGRVDVSLPTGQDGYRVVHRVYDAQGRFDETLSLSLDETDRRGLVPNVEDGTDFTARRRIPIRGGRVTVSGSNLRPGAPVNTLGTMLRAAPDGSFVIERILPPGEHNVRLKTDGVDIARDVTIPDHEWFGVGMVDLTFGTWRDEQAGDTWETYSRARLTGYGKVQTARGYTITGSADTGEQDIRDIFRAFEDKDPAALLRRLDPDDFYPTYGDDSEAFDDAPTDGRFYLRVERDGNYAMWGTGRAPLSGSHYLRNERTLYGAHGLYRSSGQTESGEARLSFQGYAAKPDRLPGREVFRGTGGSLFFLQRQDLAVGTETLTVEVRDGVTGQVLSSQPLNYGTDYDINYIQGVVTLSSPLSGFVTEGPIAGGPEPTVNLAVQYEYTPSIGDIDGLTFGGRVENWVSDTFRIGVTGQVERTATADQTAESVDFLYRLSDETQIELEFARSDGPGFDSTYSADGGLTVVTQPVSGGTGEAVRFAGRASLVELGLASAGDVSAYFERRTEGFSTLDYQVTSGTGDETVWGLAGDVPLSERLDLALVYDSYENATGEHERVGTAELTFKVDDINEVSLAVEQSDKNRGTDIGSRTDSALRLTRRPSDQLEWYVYGQATLERDGLEENNRVGVGGKVKTENGWTYSGEISSGSLGPGARVLAEQERPDGGSAYFGYELDPDRDIAGITLDGKDRGRVIAGGRSPVSDSVTVYGENSYDMFGQRRSLLSRYGVDYAPTSELSYSAALDVGQIEDPANGDFDRKGLSLGTRFDDGEAFSLRGRAEFRRDEREGATTIGTADTVLVSGDGTYKFDDTRRLVFSAKYSDTRADNSTVAEGRLTDVNLGYAFRPVKNDRLNILSRYRYLRDDYGQIVDGAEEPGARQRSHIVNVDMEYEVTARLSLGAKLGYRFAETAADDVSPFVANDAFLGVITARYHILHNWDALVDLRRFEAADAGFSETGGLVSISRHVGDHVKVGVGYNFATFSDDLSDLTFDDQGAFLNLVVRY